MPVQILKLCSYLKTVSGPPPDMMEQEGSDFAHDEKMADTSVDQEKVANMQSDLDLSNIDFLELTSCQEQFVDMELNKMCSEIFDQRDRTTLSPSNNCNQANINQSMGFLQRSSYGAPVYYFNNSTVQIHHHN